MFAKKVDLGDAGVYYLRRFTVDEYYAAGFDESKQRETLVSTLAISLAKEDGSRLYPANGKQVTPEAEAAVGDLPFYVVARLMREVKEVNGLDEAEKK